MNSLAPPRSDTSRGPAPSRTRPPRWQVTALLALLAGVSALGCTDPSGGSGPGTPATDQGAQASDVAAQADTAADASPQDASADTGPVADTLDADAPTGGTLRLTMVDPRKGLATGLEQVQLVGAGFAGRDALTVYFGESQALDPFVIDDSRMAVTTPPRTPGLVDVRVVDATTGEEAVVEAAFLYFNPVAVHAVDPASGHVLGGTPVTVTGAGFTPDTHLLFGGRAAVATKVLDDGTIQAVAPDAAGPGPVDVWVSNAQGVARLEDGFLYFAPPRVDAVDPPTGPLAGGTMVTIRGAGFMAPLSASVGGVPLESVVVLDDGAVQGVTPAADTAGPADVVVATSYGAAVGAGAFTYLPDQPGALDTLAIWTVTPPRGPATGGAQVRLIVSGLEQAGVQSGQDLTVQFAGVEATVKSVEPASHLVTVEPPAGTPGPVDVALTASGTTAQAPGAYTYDPVLRVYEVTPNFGPLEGGTPIELHGTGFAAGAQVHVGALPAASVEVLDGETLRAVTPPGAPGLANITVLQAGATDTLVGGFSYQSPLALWVVDPPHGSRAGGTEVALYGAGFPPDAEVWFGDRAATHVHTVSPSRIEARTPPGEVGAVDVTVRSASKGEIVLPSGYTYYDPEGLYGGTWGENVEGDVNVTVISGADGSPLPDVFVMLWTDPETPYQGYTNLQGQVTFSGPDLHGEQMVSASKEGFASTSVVEYDATNVTLYMTPVSSSMGAPPPGEPPPVFEGQVVNLSKYVPVPWGQCADKTDAPGTLCDPCTTDADCAGLGCHALPTQGSFCTSHCVQDSDCPDGFMCYPLNGVPEPQCVPATGQVTAFCDYTKPTILSQDVLAPPGQQVNPDGSFALELPFGELAVFCWGGIWNADLEQFTPYALGLKRHLLALPGQTYAGEIHLDHALNGQLQARLDSPPSGPNGPDFNYMMVHLDLGSDGTLQFLDDAFAFGDEPLVKTGVPKALTGDLYDATYTILAGAFSFTDDNLPYSLTLHRNIVKTEDDTIYRYAPNGWQPQSSGVLANLNDLWGLGPGDLLAVGSDGLIVRSLGDAWATQPSGVSEHLRAVHALPDGQAVAVGRNSSATFYDGATWSPMTVPAYNDLEGVWMAAPDDIFAVGWYTVLHYDGVSWSYMGGNTIKNLRDVWGFAPDDVWAVGTYGQVIHYDGSTWTDVPTGTLKSLRAVWGAAPDDLFVVGEGATILHWDGDAFTPMEPPDGVTATLESVWGRADDDVYAVGAGGTILRYDGTQWLDDSPAGYDATFLAVGGTEHDLVATGSHELLLGPMLAVPENISPADGGEMGDEYAISWTTQPGPDPHFSYVDISVPGMFGPIPEWTTVNDWDVEDILLPDFPNIEGTPGISPGFKILTVIRVYREGFDIDHYSNLDLNTLIWNSWSMDQLTFTKL